MSAPAQPAVIIIKKQGHHKHAHHGGAWKVAYADFVTAMMAFFLVMWLVAQSPQVKASVGQYFRDPGAFSEGGRGLLPGSDSGATGGGQPMGSKGVTNPNVEEAKRALEKAAEHLRQAIQLKFAAVQERVEITVTDEGLRIELREAPNDGFFSTGSAGMKPETEKILATISKELAVMPNKIAIEGHTDSLPYGAGNQYTNWELSSDRANAARRVLERSGVKNSQLEGVRGFADTKLRTKDKPMDAGNRRISIVVRRNDGT
jgi:chemotaxis protein MotB